MRPLTIITGIIMGSAASITLGLSAVVVIYLFAGMDEPRILDEFAQTLNGAGWFAILTAVSATSFIGVLRERTWRWWAQAAMWVNIAIVGWHFWP